MSVLDLDYMEYIYYVREYFPREHDEGFILSKRSFDIGLRAINSSKFKEYTYGLSNTKSSRLFILVEFVCWKLQELSPINTGDYTYMWKEFSLTIDLNTVVRRVMSGDTPLPMHYYSKITIDKKLIYKQRELSDKIALASLARRVYDEQSEFIPFCFECGSVEYLVTSPDYMVIKCRGCMKV